jgi:alpha-1,3-rhamnosyl/mannosyltransferase
LQQTAADGDEIIESDRPSAIARSRGADVFHSPWLEGAMLHSPCPMVVTLHGITAFRRRSEHLRAGMRLRLRHLAVQRALRVIVPTQALADEAIEHLRLEGDRVAVIPEAADPAIGPCGADEVDRVLQRFGLPERYLVWVGGLQHPDPSRHVSELAGAERSLPLVLVGSTREWAHELPDVILTGRVSDQELAAIYTGARALVLPSDGSGFGLPAVEALACGTPVVAFASPAMREVLGERGTLLPSGDFGGLVRAAEAAERPVGRPSSWSWKDAALATWSVYAHAGGAAAQGRAAGRGRRRRGGIDGLEIEAQ